MKLLSLVVDGLERAHKDGLVTWAFQQNADVICLQDTQCSEYSLSSNDFFPEGYHAYFADNYDDPKINGVAIYCRKMPKAIMFGLGFMDFDHLGIYIQADYENCSIGSILVPSAVGVRGDKALKCDFLPSWVHTCRKCEIKNATSFCAVGGNWLGNPEMPKKRATVSISQASAMRNKTGSDRYIARATAMRFERSTQMATTIPGGRRAMSVPVLEPTRTLFLKAYRPVC